MGKRKNWPKILRVSGFITLLIGAVDPLEGSVLILAGSVLILISSYKDQKEYGDFPFRLTMFLLMLFGVIVLWGSSFLGGFGGSTGRSLWLALLTVPYLFSWSLSLWMGISYRWVQWFGIAVSIWYFVILYIMWNRGNTHQEEMLVAPIALSILGLCTIVGCVWRLLKLNRSNFAAST